MRLMSLRQFLRGVPHHQGVPFRPPWIAAPPRLPALKPRVVHRQRTSVHLPVFNGVLDVPESDLEECCVCMERKPEVTLPCTHSYCLFCIEQWSVSNITCPLCREGFDTTGDTWVDFGSTRVGGGSQRNAEGTRRDLHAPQRRRRLFHMKPRMPISETTCADCFLRCVGTCADTATYLTRDCSMVSVRALRLKEKSRIIRFPECQA
uniref:RING finger protein 141 n=1 Tax=Ixodes ricinus TaxID=34613 RepID=A0A090XED5_IXORI